MTKRNVKKGKVQSKAPLRHLVLVEKDTTENLVITS